MVLVFSEFLLMIRTDAWKPTALIEKLYPGFRSWSKNAPMARKSSKTWKSRFWDPKSENLEILNFCFQIFVVVRWFLQKTGVISNVFEFVPFWAENFKIFILKILIFQIFQIWEYQVFERIWDTLLNELSSDREERLFRSLEERWVLVFRARKSCREVPATCIRDFGKKNAPIAM